MMKLVQMSFVNNQNDIEDFNIYVLNIVEYLLNVIGNLKYEIIENKENVAQYKMIYKNHTYYHIIFKRSFTDNISQISVEIRTRDGSYDRDILEKIKFGIVNNQKRYWERIIWLYDIEAESLSSELYNKIYRIENEFRRLINEVMIKKYGLEWWDWFVPYRVKNKHSLRRVGYKKTVPAFAAIDERLLSIDIGDLLKIITVSRKEILCIGMSEVSNEDVVKAKVELDIDTIDLLNTIINDDRDVKMEDLKHMLNKSAVVSTDLWQENFKDLLPENFIVLFEEFESDRNNIAHNKPIDQEYYNKINNQIEQIGSMIENAINQI